MRCSALAIADATGDKAGCEKALGDARVAIQK